MPDGGSYLCDHFFALPPFDSLSTARATECSLRIDKHIPALNLHPIHGHLRPRRTRLARLRVPLPAMPRANNLPARDHALPQRSSAMQADIVHGTDLAINVGDADRLVAAGKFFRFVDAGELLQGGNFGEHSMDSSSVCGADTPVRRRCS